MHISPLDPLGRAWDRMVKILFKPFDFTKWLLLGFCAFLAQCGEGGYNFPSNSGGGRGGGGPNSPDFGRWFEDNLALVVIISLILLLLFIGLALLITWLNSRGKFMFIDGIVKNRGAVKEPWTEYKREANSLFLFRIVIGLSGLAVFLVLAAIPILIAIPDMHAERFGAAATISIIVGIVFIVTFILACIAAGMFINVFLIPTMYLRRVRAIEGCGIAWRELVRGHIGPAVLLLLVMVLLGGGAMVATMLITCLTCCLAALPYVGAVILLPISVFFTAYVLEYVQQYGGDWRFFPPDTNCIACGYDLSGNPSAERCPECGSVCITETA